MFAINSKWRMTVKFYNHLHSFRTYFIFSQAHDPKVAIATRKSYLIKCLHLHSLQQLSLWIKSIMVFYSQNKKFLGLSCKKQGSNALIKIHYVKVNTMWFSFGRDITMASWTAYVQTSWLQRKHLNRDCAKNDISLAMHFILELSKK